MAAEQGSGNLVVMDADFLCASETVTKYGDKFKGVIDQYKQIMFYIATHGFVDGLITKNIIGISVEVGRYPQKLEETVSAINDILKNYVKEIEEADKFEY